MGITLAVTTALVASLTLANMQQQARVDRAAEQRAESVRSEAHLVGIGSAAINPARARLSVEIAMATDAARSARLTADANSGKASAESLRALTTSADRLAELAGDASIGDDFAVRIAALHTMRSQVEASGAAWQAAENARLAAEVRAASEALAAAEGAESDARGDDGSSDVGAGNPPLVWEPFPLATITPNPMPPHESDDEPDPPQTGTICWSKADDPDCIWDY